MSTMSLAANPTETSIDLTGEQKALIERLEKFDAPYLEEKMLADGKFASSSEYRSAFAEFKKYAALTQFVNGPLGMCSAEVDDVWHQFILFTVHYANFCSDYLGSFLHHTPHIGSTTREERRDGVLNFSAAYSGVFGDIPPIWNVSLGSDQKTDCCGGGNECHKCSSTCK